MFSAVVFADSIARISPTSVTQYASEVTLTISGDGLLGNVSTDVVYNGPGGTITVSAFDLSDSTTVYADIPGGVTSYVGSWDVYVVAHDDTGDRTIGPAVLTVTGLGGQPPLLSIPESVSAEATSAAGAIVTFTVGGYSFVDPPPAPTVTCDHDSGALYPLGETRVTCTATDSFGSTTGSFTIFVGDTVPPVITVPANILIITTNTSETVTWTASATDAIDGSVTVHCSPVSGSSFSLGTTTVQCSATDSHANTGTASFTVTIAQHQPPTLTLPADFSVEATQTNGAIVTYSATADQGATVNCSPASGTLFGFGATTVNCTATNSTGESTSGSFNVTVQDTTPPVLSLPADINNVHATSPSGAVVNYTASATDNISGSVSIFCTPPSGSTFAVGTTQVVCVAADSFGNTAQGTFNVTVVFDTTAPVVTSITASPSVLSPPNHTMINVTVTVVATDDTDPNPTSQIVSVTSNQPVNGTGDGDASPDWVITGPLTLQLRAERAGTGGTRVYTITVITSDYSGNTVTSTVTVSVPQSQKIK